MMLDRRKIQLLLAGSGIFLLLSCAPAFLHEQEGPVLSAGVAKVKITPATPIPMSGYGGRKEPFKGVHDDLFARTVVFSDQTAKAAIISVDVIGFSDEFWEDLTDRIEQETGIVRDAVLLAAMHNHGGPETMVYNPEPSEKVVACDERLKSLVGHLIDMIKAL